MRPHHYCLPVIKRETHRLALVQAATSGEPCFFLGTDSAPHDRRVKESSCGCAGIYTAHAAIAFYAEVFEREGALEGLDHFASRYGAEFYGLPLNTHSLTLERVDIEIPDTMPFGDGELVPFRAGGHCDWRVVPDE